jgi:hypothetical protein
MSQVERHKRLRLLVKTLNRERKQQAHKIDILCRDLIAAQREFMRKLSHVGFAAHFYKDLLGTGDLRGVLTRAGRLLREELPGAEITFFLRHTDGCEKHMVEGNKELNLAVLRLHDCFTPELLDSVCKSNRVCTTDDLCGMGLAANPADLAALSVATVPLNDLGRSLGFVLICRAAPNGLPQEEVEKLGLITCGLARAIRGCSVPLPFEG